MTHRGRFLTLSIAALALSTTARAAEDRPLQELGTIVAAAESAVRARGPGIAAKADAPDPRLRLARCDRALTTMVPPGNKTARLAVRVRCEGNSSWSVLVPVEVSTEVPVVVSTRALVPGAVLGPADMALVPRRIPGFIECCATDLGSLSGQRVRRPIPADVPIPLDSIEAPPLIRRGELVTVVAGAPGFEVRSAGTALGDAREGDAVRVRHATSLRIIQARADSRGVVRADP
jgi:flagella basal body P-ring formation protein FlgA